MTNQSLFDLSGRVALVTGGSKGLGKAMAQGLARAGAEVVISSRHQDELDKALAEILEGTDGKGLSIVADLTQREEAERLARSTLEKMGRVDVLVNNAGSNIPGVIDEVRDADWDRILELNLSACMVLTRALVPQMKERRWGRIIHISSIMGLGGKASRNVYNASKHGLIGLSKANALDLGPYNITVNCIAPGPFWTDLPASLLNQEQKAVFARRTALGRWGEAEELVGPALLLATEAGSYITGETLVVDGGVLANVL
jgi:NAD(P)-dependent dehydrogenase (short-subunit alcohol dehydrogenase family)